MKLKTLQENLKQAVSLTARFASSKAQLPVLGNILLKADKGSLMLSATNLELSVAISIGADVKEKGEITVPAKTFYDLISNLSPSTIDIEVSKERMKVTTDQFKSNISAMNSSDFPLVPNSIGTGGIKLDKQKLTNTLSKVLYAASSDETRPVLTGVLVIFTSNKLTFVSTDGFRLSVKSINVEKGLKEKQIILPKNALSELMRISSEDDDIQMNYKKSDNQVIFAVDDVVLSWQIFPSGFMELDCPLTPPHLFDNPIWSLSRR